MLGHELSTTETERWCVQELIMESVKKTNRIRDLIAHMSCTVHNEDREDGFPWTYGRMG